MKNISIYGNTLLRACSSLVSVSSGHAKGAKLDDGVVLRLAHFSVKKYLVSEEIRTNTAKVFAVFSGVGHRVMAEFCLNYLLRHGQRRLCYFQNQQNINDFIYVESYADSPQGARKVVTTLCQDCHKFELGYPFISYAADEWAQHAKEANAEKTDRLVLDSLVCQLLHNAPKDTYVHKLVVGRPYRRIMAKKALA